MLSSNKAKTDYEILNVPRNAIPNEIEKAYKQTLSCYFSIS